MCFPWDIPAEMMYLGHLGHGPLSNAQQRTMYLKNWTPQVLVVGCGLHKVRRTRSRLAALTVPASPPSRYGDRRAQAVVLMPAVQNPDSWQVNSCSVPTVCAQGAHRHQAQQIPVSWRHIRNSCKQALTFGVTIARPCLIAYACIVRFSYCFAFLRLPILLQTYTSPYTRI